MEDVNKTASPPLNLGEETVVDSWEELAESQSEAEEDCTCDDESSCYDDSPKVEKEEKKPTAKTVTLSLEEEEDDDTDEEEGDEVATATATAVAAATDEDLQTLREAFALFDVDKSGVIPRERLQPCLQTVCSTLPQAEIEEILEQVDEADEDVITFETFADLARWTQTILQKEREILEAFKMFDPEGRGYLTSEALTLALVAFDRVISDAEAQQLIKMLVTSDGRFYYEPFINNLKEMGLLDEL